MQPRQHSELGCELVADVAQRFGEVRLKVHGLSMIPSIWPGDVITIRRLDTAGLRSGDVVVYRRERGLVAHRITRVRGDDLVTRGDSKRHDDPPIKRGDVVGQVVWLVRNGHRVGLSQSCWQRAVSSTVTRSELCRRVVLRVGLCWRSVHGRAGSDSRRAGDRR